MSIIEELRWRGMVQDIMPGTEDYLTKNLVTGYVGFDPTADSLHIGSLVPIFLLVHLQKAGHKPIALVGGATGMVGDPSGKSEERNLLDIETLRHNQQGVKKQLMKFLSFDSSLPNAAEMVNNFDWFQSISFLDFIRDTGKFITVNYMTAKDSVKKRLESPVGMSFTEFTYQLIQGYDFYWLYKNKNCKLQMGGSDQWGNIVTGTELIRRKDNGEAYAFTCPLIKKADGGKFGKTEKGNIWLDAEKTTPYQFYQFWLNASDEDVKQWIKIFTFLPKEEIDSLLIQHEANPAARILQKKLAAEITAYVHGQDEREKAISTTEKLFANTSAPVDSLTTDDLENMDGIIKSTVELSTLTTGVDITSLLVHAGVATSKGEARKLITGGGISINRLKVVDVQLMVNTEQLLHNQYVLLQKGKKNYYLVKAI